MCGRVCVWEESVGGVCVWEEDVCGKDMCVGGGCVCGREGMCVGGGYASHCIHRWFRELILLLQIKT